MVLAVMLNNFMHDFSAAGWLIAAVLMWRLLKRELPVDSDGRDAVLDMFRLLNRFMWWTLAGIVGFGVIRLLAYTRYEWNPQAGDAQVTMLIIKHIVLTAIFAWGVWIWIRGIKRMKEWQHG